jgi:phospholipase C
MDRFDQIGAGKLPFVFYPEAQIPNYWRLARDYVLADHLFSTTLGPSTPGHAVFWTGQSLVLANPKCTHEGGDCGGHGCTAGADVRVLSYDPDTCTTKKVEPCFDVPTLVDHLPKGFTWRDYGGPIAMMVKSIGTAPGYKKHFRTHQNLLDDLATGTLANLMIVHGGPKGASEHPPQHPCKGEATTTEIINRAMARPEWKEMAVIVTWDDWGGFYDHVEPPKKHCKNGEVFQSGFRLPALFVSPYAKKGHVLKTPTEQAAIPRLVEELWGMEFMTKRDPRARDGKVASVLEAFDFAQPPRPPSPLPKRSCP